MKTKILTLLVLLMGGVLWAHISELRVKAQKDADLGIYKVDVRTRDHKKTIIFDKDARVFMNDTKGIPVEFKDQFLIRF